MLKKNINEFKTCDKFYRSLVAYLCQLKKLKIAYILHEAIITIDRQSICKHPKGIPFNVYFIGDNTIKELESFSYPKSKVRILKHILNFYIPKFLKYQDIN